MKRLLPLLLGLAVSVAQADSNSDYRAGSDFARQIQGQGTGSIQGFKPQESIPGYNANPDETKYFGGVTAGGDGGLKNDGTTEWATGETGKTITESFMNAKWHLNRSQFGIRIDHDLAFISDHSLASQSITIWHASDH